MSDLNFQNFGLEDSPFTNPNTDRRNPSNLHDTTNLVTGNIDLNDDTTATKTEGVPGPYIFSLKYYQQFFDVDQGMVYNRLLRSVIPSLKGNFILDHVQPLPDLYGPLWICITFIFSTAICGNLAHYIETHGKDHYENDFGLVTGATTIVASYVMLVPFCLRWLLWYRNPAISYSYLELLCAYGYAMTIFVPVSILWVVHFHAFRWFLILSAIGVSGLMLFNIVWPAVRSDPNKAVAFAIVGGVLLLHASVGFGFKAYYFDSAIPSQHGVIEKPEAPLPPSEAAVIPEQGKVDKVDKPDAPAQVDGKKVTRDLSDQEKATEANNQESPKDAAKNTQGSSKTSEKKDVQPVKATDPSNNTKKDEVSQKSNTLIKKDNEVKNTDAPLPA